MQFNSHAPRTRLVLSEATLTCIESEILNLSNFPRQHCNNLFTRHHNRNIQFQLKGHPTLPLLLNHLSFFPFPPNIGRYSVDQKIWTSKLSVLDFIQLDYIAFFLCFPWQPLQKPLLVAEATCATLIITGHVSDLDVVQNSQQGLLKKSVL